MRPIWSGSVNFGLINIPVNLYSATSETSLDLDMLHKKDGEKIRYARVCVAEDEEVPYEEIVKGFQIEEGNYVILSPEDFKRANARKTQMIEIQSFVESKDIDPIYFEKPYYLEPRKGADKAYALLREALARSDRVGVATFVLRNRENPCIVKPHGDALMIVQLRFHAAIRDAGDLKLPKLKASPKEIKMAMALIDHLEDKFDPTEFRDTYTAELKRVIAAKAKGKPVPVKGKTPPRPTKVTDLVRLLNASLEKQKGKREPALTRVRR